MTLFKNHINQPAAKKAITITRMIEFHDHIMSEYNLSKSDILTASKYQITIETKNYKLFVKHVIPDKDLSMFLFMVRPIRNLKELDNDWCYNRHNKQLLCAPFKNLWDNIIKELKTQFPS